MVLLANIHLSLNGQNSIYNCDNELFFNNTNFRLFSIDISDDFSDYSFVEITTRDWRDNFLDALAYNPLKKEVLAIEDIRFTGPSLVALDSLGLQRTILPFGNEDISFNIFQAAAFSLDFNTYFAVRNTTIVFGTNIVVAPTQLFRFNLTTDPVTYDSIPIITTSGTPLVAMVGLAINPVDGLGYGYQAVSGNLVTLDLETGVLDDLRYPTSANDREKPDLASLRFSAFGEITALTGKPEFRLIKISTVTGLVEEEITGGPTFNLQGNLWGGFYCPYTIGLRQRALADTITRCGSFTAELTLGVVSDGNNLLELRDTFPDGFVVEEVLRNPYGGTVSGLGTNVFNLRGFRAENGADTILLRVSAGPELTAGTYTFQATLNDLAQSTSVFPANTLRSDYLPTPAVPDPSPIVIVELAEEVPDTSFQRCAGETVLLDPFSPGLDQTLAFNWSTGATTPAITVATGGQFRLATTDLCGAVDTFLFTVTDGSISIDLGPDLFGTYGNIFQLVPEIRTTAEIADFRYTAADSTIFSCTDCRNTLVEPTMQSSLIRLEASTIFGCRATDSIIIRLERPLYQPTAFSPNGDGINDCFQIFSGGPIQNLLLKIYDRWGGLIYQNEADEATCTNGWDGRVNGQAAPVGVYAYVAELTFPDGSKEFRSGLVSLLR